ncbi:11751_t:CDS:2 [Acaulospora colombiana]|uniref:11751_t:CDS:1 n=1 Tax=Acaulospora colombiana TaxID=27376 RepID=A0ACA9MLZ0_9GLOM|nr:11751_t:CDS:2 [Acaulospora colombiana]
MSNPSTTTLTTTAPSPTPPQTGVKRKRGPPAPLNLASSSSSASLIVFAGPDRDDDGTAPADIPPAMPQPEETTTSTTAPAPVASTAAPSKPSNPSRNVKRLSLSISGTSIAQNLAPSIASPIARDSNPPPLPQPRRPSIASLPGASASSILRRNDEGDSSASAYLDGPIEIMPGIWLGSEDNARDWQGLIKRGIKSILNVAKEVASPFESASQPTRNTRAMSVPNAQAPRNMQSSTYQPAHLPSGRPPMHYLKLAWSHGQSDLVHSGFAHGIKFCDDALARKEAANAVSLDPRLCLIYQLLDYERALKGQDSPGRSSTGASEDEEWERRRQQLDSPDQESQEILKEAKELDREMEERRARRLSLASTSSNPSSFTGAIGNATHPGVL